MQINNEDVSVNTYKSIKFSMFDEKTTKASLV